MPRALLWLALLARTAALSAPRSLLRATHAARAVTMAASPKDLVIWDCDGVLVDSEALLKQSEVEAINDAAIGVTVTRDDCNRLFSGFAPEAGEANFLKEYGTPLPKDFFKDQIEGSAELFRKRLTQLNAKTVLALHAAGRKQVVASGSPRDRVLVCLEVAGIDHCFTPEQVFTREDVPGRGKPQPDMFLLAAERSGVAPSACVVVEDSTAGVRAAQAAEMECVGFLGGGHAQADWYRDNLGAFGIPMTYSDTELLEYLS